ncbi:phosphoglucosamine mutase [Edaphobacter albus]|uniref:phosphoglucosamine mutase n=1 Tax=Edaphobacter sp. 4G125 TaxID=2763071 RepID=UPI0016487805|nr:phosphoglucosamine mutase [Edaphobacter sp. 4G125]QNI36343.1 phosphoglucosamine mutase [Edaphobacter sp. 4G125]
MKKLFGTDGIRSVAGQYPLDPSTVHAVGLALAHHLGASPRVLFGMDTRESGSELAAQLSTGLVAGGASIESAGVITTPAIAYLTRTHRFSAGIVISASHNPWQDNGIKVFGPDGYKLPDSTELAIEEEIFKLLASTGTRSKPTNGNNAPVPPVNEADRADYIRFLLAAVPGLSLGNRRVVLDCANGAASAVAPELFAQLGGEVLITHASPDGRNINEQCGALHPEMVAAQVAHRKADLGITFDGDADRALFADEQGRVVNGDAVLLLAARDLQARGLLANSTVVATTMSNMGLEAALKRSGIQMLRAAVGDKYVLEQMLSTNAVLGGEQSGHIIFSGRSTTGDGLLTALLVLDIVHRSGKSLSELIADLKVFPQVIVNVKVREKKPLDRIPTVVAAIAAAEKELADSGRVVIRYSGTEALARVMIEAESEPMMRYHAETIANAIRTELGI